MRHYNIGYAGVHYNQVTEYNNKYSVLGKKTKAMLDHNANTSERSLLEREHFATNSSEHIALEESRNEMQLRHDNRPAHFRKKESNPYSHARNEHNNSLADELDSLHNASLVAKDDRMINKSVIEPQLPPINPGIDAEKPSIRPKSEFGVHPLPETKVPDATNSVEQIMMGPGKEDRKRPSDEWAQIIRQQAKSIETNAKKEENERQVRVKQYRNMLDMQLQEKKDQVVQEKVAKVRAKEYVSQHNAELDKLEKERLMQEREFKALTRKEYDRQIAEQKASARAVKYPVSTHNPVTAFDEDPFFLQDTNRVRFREVHHNLFITSASIMPIGSKS